ncbi:MAG: hypothetical protein HWE13_10870 [Gammaproteobacteria bacterium]|nr:hypothetical protein [Gammaproteobacteria bacterium]NVK88624.1 hypothetical protein [Gammaproteobacteria bacterium]
MHGTQLLRLWLVVILASASWFVAAEPKQLPRALERPIDTGSDITLVCWYRSHACATLLHALQQRQATVTLLPAVFRHAWQNDAKWMLLANDFNLTLAQHLALMETLAQAPDSITNEAQFIEWAKPYLSDREPAQIEAVVYSSEIGKRLKAIQHQLQAAQISKVPTLIYQGRFALTPQADTSAQQLLLAIDELALQQQEQL